MKFDSEELNQIADAVSEKVLARLKPLLRLQATSDKVLGVKELAEYISQKPSWVYAHIEEIPHAKKGGLLMFKKSAIDKWLEPDYYPVPEDIQFSKRRRVA